jgi:hypothetical protein
MARHRGGGVRAEAGPALGPPDQDMEGRTWRVKAGWAKHARAYSVNRWGRQDKVLQAATRATEAGHCGADWRRLVRLGPRHAAEGYAGGRGVSGRVEAMHTIPLARPGLSPYGT